MGLENVLRVPKETTNWLEKNNIRYVILNSYDAIIEYHNARNNTGILLRSTC